MIESHIADLPSLIPDVDVLGAQELYECLVNKFQLKTTLRKTNTMRSLRMASYLKTETLDNFIKKIQELRKEAIDAGNDIPDSVF